jgi:hypothetical protein
LCENCEKFGNGHDLERSQTGVAGQNQLVFVPRYQIVSPPTQPRGKDRFVLGIAHGQWKGGGKGNSFHRGQSGEKLGDFLESKLVPVEDRGSAEDIDKLGVLLTGKEVILRAPRTKRGGDEAARADWSCH